MLSAFAKLKKNHKRIFAFIIGTAIILVWRGIWGLADLYIFPKNETYSYLASIVIGIIILASSHYMMEGLI